MRVLIKPKELITYAAFCVAFVLLALLGKWDGGIQGAVFYRPFTWIGDGIRSVGEVGIVFAYALYVIICLSPLVFPLLRLCKTKRLRLRDLAWLCLSVFLFVMIYFFINPHKIQFALFGAGFPDEARLLMRSMTLLGLSVTFYAILAICLLWEFFARLQKDEGRVYCYARVVFSVLIIGVLFEVFFTGLLGARLNIESIPKDIDVIHSMNINRAVNIFVIVLGFLLKTAPSFFTVILFLRAREFILCLQGDMLSTENIPKLKGISKTCIAAVFVGLGAMTAENLLCLSLSDILVNAYYNASIPLAMILAACLIMIFSKILIKAIEVNEENKLVI